MLNSRSAHTALLAGVIGPPLFVVVFLIDGMIHPAYSAVTDFVSELSRGELGWLQVLNFLVLAVAMIVFAAGIRWGVRRGPGSTAGAIIFLIIGLGLLGAAIFTTDDHRAAQPTTTGILHDLASLPVFAGVATACFVFARRFRGALRTYSVASGIFVVVSFFTIFPLGDALNLIGVLQRICVIAGWAWITVLALNLWREPVPA